MAKDYLKRNFVDKTHEKFSKSILTFSNSIDAFFANDKHEDLENRSKLRISLDTYFREGRGPYAIPDMDYRLMLPRTEKRLQLFVENEDKENETSNVKVAGNQGQDRRETNSLGAGLRYMVKKSGVDFATDTGVLVNLPVVVFGRFTAKKKIQLKEWVFKIDNQVKWVNDEGFSNDLDLDFDKQLNKSQVFRFVNNIYWQDNDYTIRFENGPSLFHKLNRRSALAYHAHVISLNEPGWIISNYLLQITYRQDVYKNWIFMELTPYINFPRENNFHRTPGFLIGFQAVFGHIR